MFSCALEEETFHYIILELEKMSSTKTSLCHTVVFQQNSQINLINISSVPGLLMIKDYGQTASENHFDT